jgi:hypothetical protein
MNRKEIKQLDDLWSVVVKEKAKYKCEHCGRYDSRMEAAHVVGRRHRATRWGCYIGEKYDLCGHCFCHTCHQEYDEHGPLEPEIIITIGEVRKSILQNEATRKVTKWQDFEEIKGILEQERAANDDSPYSMDD